LAAEKVSIEFDAKVPQVAFAADEIKVALTKTGHEAVAQGGGWRIVFATADAKLGVQAYRVTVLPEHLVQIAGGDVNGLMYGGLEVAEAIRLNGGPQGIVAAEGKPHIERRGIKFNIPLDARTPSYSDASDSAQQNIPEMWSQDFWHTFLDEMARHRFNVLTLWSLHPFPSMVKVPEFPDVALNDVMRTTVKFDSTYSLMGHDMVRPEHLKNLETIKKLTIDEKVAFWREVMQYAHDRGIDVYVFTWNIFTFGADGHYGITHEQNNPKTIEYFRASVREMIRTYPLLAGIGITSGERMSDRKDEFAKEKWLWKTYGEGLRDGLKDQPNRPFRLIHRYHQSALKPIMDEWKDCPGTFELSYKYAIAHMYSAPAPTFAKKSLAEMPPNLRMWMTVRNDDIYSFRWGDPDFARDFVRALPGPDKLAGYYMGPDGYTWGRAFLSTEPDEPRALVLQNQWFSFLLWGRLSYNPALPNAFFEKVLSQHFPGTDGAKLSRAMAEAGQIIPQVTRFYWQDIDLKWFPEACISHPKHYRGFHTVKHFVEGQSMPGAGVLSIGEFIKRTQKKEAVDGQTPPQVVEALRTHANAALQLVSELGEPNGTAGVPLAGQAGKPDVRKELRLTLGDQKAMALLGLYYAEKIAGAIELGFFDATGEAQRQLAAVQHLEKALEHWKAYAAVATKQYRPQLLTRVGYVDLNALTEKVAEDIAMAKAWKRK
jgi:hypothetical protein